MPAPSPDPAAHYDRVAAGWEMVLGEDWHHGVFSEPGPDLFAATAELTRLMIEAGDVRPGVEVLDAGCATGAQACRLARDHEARVLGISTSGISVERARARAERLQLADRARFEQLDALDTGLPDGSIDLVWALESAQYMLPRERMMAEFTRLLRPGGRLALCDVVLRRELTLADLRRLRRELAVLSAGFGESRLGTVVEFVTLATEHGLEVELERDLSEAVRPTFARWRERADALREQVVPLIGEPSWTGFREGCDVLDRFYADGTMGYALLAARKPS